MVQPAEILLCHRQFLRKSSAAILAPKVEEHRQSEEVGTPLDYSQVEEGQAWGRLLRRYFLHATSDHHLHSNLLEEYIWREQGPESGSSHGVSGPFQHCSSHFTVLDSDAFAL